MRIITKISIYLSIFLLCHISLFAQEVGEFNSVYEVNNFVEVPPSPDAAALGKYGDVPVSLYTGTPSINIPIWEAKSKKLSLPVSLSYHAGGFKVDEISSWVGLGWSLNAGGVVARTMRGFPDERDNGYFDISPYISNTGYTGYGEWAEKEFYWEAAKGNIDTEPDVFNFNFNGYSGKFVIQKNAGIYVVKLTSEQNLKVDVTIDEGEPVSYWAPQTSSSEHCNWVPVFTGGIGVLPTWIKVCDENTTSECVLQTFHPERSIKDFTITIPDGTKYYFSRTEVTNNISGSSEVTSRSEIRYVSAWYLTKITSPFEEDEINITYYDEIDLFAPCESEFQVNPLEIYDNSITETAYTLQTSSTSGCSELDNNKRTSVTTIVSYKIHEIITDNQIIEFIPSTEPRSDLMDGSGSYLKAIHIRDRRTDTEIKRFKLGHSYFQSGVLTYYGNYRLKLDSIKEYSGDESLSLPAYKFSYNSNLPSRGSYNQDHWGYYNGANNTTTFIPEDIDAFQEGADREAHNSYSTCGLINRIDYPTGGYTRFIFEGHDYYDETIPAENINVDAFLEFTPDDDEIVTYRNIDFNQNGYMDFSLSPLIGWDEFENPIVAVVEPITVLTGDPHHNVAEFTYITDNGRNSYTYNENNFTVDEGEPDGLLIKQLILGQGWYRISLKREGWDNGSNFSSNLLLSYKKYGFNSIVNSDAGGARIKQISNYSSENIIVSQKNYEYTQLLDDAKSSGFLASGKPHYDGILYNDFINKYLGLEECKYYTRNSGSYCPLGNTQGSHIGYSTVTEYLSSSEDNGKTIYEFLSPKEYRDYRYNMNPYPPIESEDWKRGHLIKQTVLDSSNKKVVTTINIYDLIENTDFFALKAGFERISCLADEWEDSTKYFIDHRTYEIKGGIGLLSLANTIKNLNGYDVTESKTFLYDSKNQLKIETKKIGNFSLGEEETLQNNYYYPYDLSGSLYSALFSKNIINEKVEVETFKGNTKIKGSLSSYKLGQNDIISKDTIFNYENGAYKGRVVFDRYDEYGNIIQLHKINDMFVSYIWGYNSTLPVARIENCTYNEIQAAIGQTELNKLKLNTLSDQEIRDKINVLRDSLPSANVTTYTYDLLTGMTSQSDPNGKITHYEYDGLGRLTNVRDNDTNLLKEYEYYYQTDNEPIEISGTIQLDATGLEGVIVGLSNGVSTVSDDTGGFSLLADRSFNGSISFEKEGYDIATLNISELGEDLNLDIINASRISYTISGYVFDRYDQPVVHRIENIDDYTNTDVNGYYEFNVEYGTSVLISIYAPTYLVTSLNKPFSQYEFFNIQQNYTNQNFTLFKPIISGRVIDSNGDPVIDAEVNAIMEYDFNHEAFVYARTNTDDQGNFDLEVYYNWSYVNSNITINKNSFEDLTITVDPNVITDVTIGDIVLQRTPLSISGVIKDINNNNIEGVLVTTNSGQSVTTTASGAYSFTVDYDWNGTVSVSHPAYTFANSEFTYSNQISDVIQNYNGTIKNYEISGKVKDESGVGLSGAEVSITGQSSITTTSTGLYSFTVNHGWTGTISVSKTGYSFTTSLHNYDSPGVILDQPNQDFTGTINTYVISGTIHDYHPVGISGVTVKLSDNSDSFVTGSDGIYTLTAEYGWNGYVEVSKTGYTFEKDNCIELCSVFSINNLDQIYNNIDFEGTKLTYAISGTINGIDDIVENVQVTFSDLSSTNPSSNGVFSKNVDYNWSGRVTPIFEGYDFNPIYTDYSEVVSMQRIVNYTATLKTYKVSGHIKKDGVGLSGVSVAYSGLGSVTTNSSGYYEKTVDYGWEGSITPSKTGYTFSPGSIPISSTTSVKSNQNFDGTINTYTISGTIRDYHPIGISGVTVKLSDNSDSFVTGSDGTYTLTAEYGWSGTISVSKYGYEFERKCVDPNFCLPFEVNNINTNYSNINFEGTKIYKTISGRISYNGSALSNVKLTFEGLSDVYTNSSGNYTKSVAYGWSGKVTPSKTGYNFSPEYINYSNVIVAKSFQNYTATLKTYKVSGYITKDGSALSSVSVSFSGLGTVTTNSSGYYYKYVNYNWNGTITPSKTGYTFSPSSISPGSITYTKSNQNFTATLKTYTITGYVKDDDGNAISGASLSMSTGGTKTSSSTGYYSFSVNHGWTGSISVSKTGYTFSTSTRNYSSAVVANKSNQNFVGEVIMIPISGRIYSYSPWLGEFGIGDVIMTDAKGSETGTYTAITNSEGYYTVYVPYGWNGSIYPYPYGDYSPKYYSYSNVTQAISNKNYEKEGLVRL